MITVITCATRRQPHIDEFEESCAHFGIVPIFLGMGQFFGGLGMKLKLCHEFLYKRPADEDILFTDSFDAVFVQPLDVIQEHWSSFQSSTSILMSAERNCFPYHERAEEYPKTKSPYRFLNGGGWLAKAGAMTELLERCKCYSIPDGVNDQGTLMDYYLANPQSMALDTEQEIFQCLYHGVDEPEHMVYDEGLVRNKCTGTFPAVLHGNGGVDMADAYNWL